MGVGCIKLSRKRWRNYQQRLLQHSSQITPSAALPMNTSKITMLCVLVALLMPPLLAAQPSHTGTGKTAQKILMKNWALSSCFARITQDVQTKKDAGATARAYLENSQQDLAAFEQIGKLVDKYIMLKYGGSDNANYNTMKCIDLFHSKELDQLANKYIKIK
jgi:Type VI secretion system (T6SS), amidase immunity protein